MSSFMRENAVVLVLGCVAVVVAGCVGAQLANERKEIAATSFLKAGCTRGSVTIKSMSSHGSAEGGFGDRASDVEEVIKIEGCGRTQIYSCKSVCSHWVENVVQNASRCHHGWRSECSP